VDLTRAFVDHVRSRHLLPAGARVLVACSGGADSTALAHLVVTTGDELGLADVALGHLDHGLRTGSASDREFVEDLATELGVACAAERTRVQPGPGESPEAAARRVRYAFLADAAAARGMTHVVTAHHADDQAETVLLRILRGTGPAGLAGIREHRPLAAAITVVRPLLGIRRVQLRDWLSQRGRSWREDPTNVAGNDRARVRHLALPALAESAGRDPVPLLARLAANAAAAAAPDERELVDAFAEDRPDALVLLPGFERLPPGPCLDLLRRRVPRLRSGEPLTRQESVRLLAMLGGDDREAVAGLQVETVAGTIRIAPAREAPSTWSSVPIAMPGTTRLSTGESLSVDVQAAGNAPFLERLACRDGSVEIADAGALQGPLNARPRREGDRIRPLGAEGEVRLGHLLQRRGVAHRERDRLALVCDDAGIVWVPGVCVADRVRVRPDTRRIALLRRS
jgi:tRNA(Ile)-lysidine synthase